MKPKKTNKVVRLTPRQLEVLEDIDTGDMNRVYDKVSFRGTGSVTRVIRRLVRLGMLDEERNAELTAAGRMELKKHRFLEQEKLKSTPSPKVRPAPSAWNSGSGSLRDTDWTDTSERFRGPRGDTW